MRYIASILMSLFWFCPAYSAVKVVTSFSILGDLVKQIGGNHVLAESIVGPNEDAHVFNPAPQHSMMLAQADLVIVNGMGLEGWMDRLIDASGCKGAVIIASHGVRPLKLEDKTGPAEDPHAWHSIPAIMKYVDNISHGLQQIDPKNANAYRKNATSYKQRLRYLDEWIRDELSKVDVHKRKIITAHDAFQYFAQEYGVTFLAPVGVSTAAEASPDTVRSLIDLIKKERIQLIFVENITNEKQIDIIRESTGARIGGTLFSDALSAQDGPATDYISLMKHNVSLFMSAMSH